ncbi:MAG: hypothetical protein JEZ03_03865 [Bacteroidales bacterium]|nr:hypothetical protein [Bacteroidales bacterium]
MKKEIELLKNQIDKLSEKQFDLEAWKSYTSVLLGRIFGEKSHKITEINRITYNFGSWTLRDTSGKETTLDSCKKKGKEILEASINELENFGLASKQQTEDKLVDVRSIIEPLADELKGSQIKAIQNIIEAELESEEKKRQITEILISLDLNSLTEIIVSIIMNPKISNNI